ncbi:DUF2189 domain-containing protein [Kiloniella litopenaei]|uniref:DUF2189 domain-containing protein n=1 Tax=Kiloniella litopenaei TaxID=1549748 RepID=UPI003BA8A86A
MPKTATQYDPVAHLERDAVKSIPKINKITVEDLMDVLAKGLNDFKHKPSHIVLLAIIYPIIGLLAARMTAGYDIIPLAFPIVSGFALLGPIAALGLYELSRRREKGMSLAWRHVFNICHSPAIGSISALGILLTVIFLVWLVTALALFKTIFGTTEITSIGAFISQVLTTPAGWNLILVGCGVGFVFAVVVLAISVISFPMLLDKDISAALAVQTSVKVVMTNPIPIAVWGAIVAGSMLVGSIPAFVGLCVVMPVLGHSTWHLYRKVVVQ